VKLETVEQLAVFYEPSPERRRKIGRLARKQRQILFEYEPEFLGSKLELSPFHLPACRCGHAEMWHRRRNRGTIPGPLRLQAVSHLQAYHPWARR
jgi:hypothetical protein